MLNLEASPISTLCLGMGWFPQTPGGLNRYVHELILQLATQGKVELCGVGLPAYLLNPPIMLTDLASPHQQLPQRLWSVHQRFQQRQMAYPDAINLHFALYSFPLLQSFPKNVPVTFTFHGPWAFEGQQEGEGKWSTLFKQWIEKRVYDRCDRFIVLSKAFGTILHETYSIPWNKIHIIPGGVDTQRFQRNLSRQEARSQLSWHLDRPTLFTTRRLVHRMGLDKLLTALVEVKRQVPDVWLAIAGKGPIRADLEQQVQRLRLQDNVKFLGFLPDEQLPLAYQAADLTVVPSQSLEGFGLILLESLAAGTPALCTPVGGMPEVITPFCPELITDSIEAEAIAERLTDFLTGKLPLPSRDACREYACRNFDWQIIAPRVRQVLLSREL
ncbi:MAG: glycosyltransferase family 4 protein [Drouetiella hepatica Uher 2000/2452]|uniref:Glycosyltransferase family 4 protein n=1 Tax=Drouetiella hepatica Uher 2000/2452 TaxID=904376 RepID=A0A951ULZ5_9CYAN|nr:glycosyltransferase family 4 protein [Drouetiella hepatica Uher 2000/2452]